MKSNDLKEKDSIILNIKNLIKSLNFACIIKAYYKKNIRVVQNSLENIVKTVTKKREATSQRI